LNAWLRQTRVRLALAYSGIFGLVALVAATGSWLAIRQIENSAVDDSLAAAARPIGAALASGGSLPGGHGSGATSSDDGAGVAAFLFDPDARLVDSTGVRPSPGAFDSLVRQSRSTGSTLYQTQTIDGVPERLRASPVSITGVGTKVLVVARSRAATDQIVGTAATVLALGMAVVVIVGSVLGYGLAGTALRPVREILATAREFSEHDLHRRIELDLPGDELGQLADTFNRMLARLETAFDGLQRFTADAAHELRAPLALIRTEAEVTLSRPRTAEQYQASLGTILGEAQRLGKMADQLLMLSRAEAGALQPQFESIDLTMFARDTARLWQPLAAERSVSVISNSRGRGMVRADRDLLRRLLDNLIDNALRHAPAGSEIVVSTSRRGRDVEMEVADSGPGVPHASQASIFERFSRADESRTRDTGGAGLGLALCAAIAQLHGGSIRLDDRPGPGARFVVALPAAELKA
jgi:two-component system OmpR family sensor kinase